MYFSLDRIVHGKIVQCLQRPIGHYGTRGAEETLIVSNRTLRDAHMEANKYARANVSSKTNTALTKLVEEMGNAVGVAGMIQAL